MLDEPNDRLYVVIKEWDKPQKRREKWKESQSSSPVQDRLSSTQGCGITLSIVNGSRAHAQSSSASRGIYIGPTVGGSSVIPSKGNCRNDTNARSGGHTKGIENGLHNRWEKTNGPTPTRGSVWIWKWLPRKRQPWVQRRNLPGVRAGFLLFLLRRD